jgi:hypothetical protein
MSNQPLSAAPLLCHEHLLQGQARAAWVVAGGLSLCIRCAVERRDELDDMDQHDLFALAYEDLRAQGHPLAY